MSYWAQVEAIRHRWDFKRPIPYEKGEVEFTPAAAKEDVDFLLALVDRAKEALIWCSGSSDFAPGGFAREGWLKAVMPLLAGAIAEPIIPGHVLWPTFIGWLEGPEGCNFREEPDPANIHKTVAVWTCGGGMDKSKTAAILHQMGLTAQAVDDSLKWYTEHGGHCDCEIIFNIALPGRPQTTHHVSDKTEAENA